MGKRERKISRFTGRWINEQGAGTVEYVIVVLVAIVIGGGLLGFGNQVSGQVTKTGDSISSWFSKANGTGGTGGGNAGGGADSRIDELKEKDPADWTLDDQKAVAEDIEKKGSGTAGTASATTDKVFLLSTTEAYGDVQSDGTQYEYYKSKGVTTSEYSGASSRYYHWTRFVYPSKSTSFRYVSKFGDRGYGPATDTNYVFPAWCF